MKFHPDKTEYNRGGGDPGIGMSPDLDGAALPLKEQVCSLV